MLRKISAAAIAASLALGAPISNEVVSVTPLSFVADLVGASSASADNVRREVRREVRRTARRTARRVERRHDRLRVLPAGCRVVIIGNLRHWRCGGLYYRRIVENGVDVYIIVTP